MVLLVIGCMLAFVSLRALGFDPPCILRGRLVGTGYGAKTDRQPIPSVDGDNCERQINQLPFAEAAASVLRHANSGGILKEECL